MSITPIREPRNLVVCCDGTGNVWKPGPGKTNVVKLVESLVRDPERQLYYYDPGVGTPDGYVSEAGQAVRDVVRRVAGLVWGDGVWANVAAGYAFLVRNYTIGDRIYVFGFSRGAFTARAVAGLVDLFGVLRCEHENLIPTLLKVYRTRPHAKSASSEAKALKAGAKKRKDIGSSLRQAFSHDEKTPVHFVGVWDTVESVGLSQLALGSRITSEPTVKPAYRHVRHALALDELRWPYEPRLYIDPKFPDDERTFKQVWFAGVHSDIGGGYRESGLANASLHWMLREASLHELLIDFDELDKHRINALDTLHDETAKLPLWVSVGAFRRAHPESMCVHESVVERTREARMKYQPVLAAGTATASTSPICSHRGDAPITRPVPTMNPPRLGQPVRDGIRAWHWAWLIVAAALTGWAFAQSQEDELALACMQLFDGWKGTLCQSLASWHSVSGKSIGALLWSDTRFIVCYAVLLPIASFFLLRLAGRDGAASPLIGQSLRYSAGFLPLADLLENFLTHLATRHAAEVTATSSTVWPAAYSYAIAIASTAKFAFLLTFVVTAAACFVALIKRLSVTKPPAPATA